MLFASWSFALFLSVTFALYWAVRNAKWQNGILVVASIVFYAEFDWRMCILFLASVLITWMTGMVFYKWPNRGGGVIYINIALLLLLLGVFKYFNFFSASVAGVLSRIGLHTDPLLLSIALPVGVSFWTFMEIAYLVDVRKGRISPERSLFSFMSFMTFFPQIAAGPIGRAVEMIPQFTATRRFDETLATDGMRQFLWGAFKKVAVADVAAGLVARIFIDYTNLPGLTLLLGAIIFSIQIYADFSGYSDMAIGVGKLLGIRLRRNFSYPYFATNIQDFWRRWHISLTTWFRDYIYFPLGGSRCSKIKQTRNVVTVFLASGLWHGANWTYVVWGFIHGILFIPRVLLGGRVSYLRNGRVGKFGSWTITIFAVVIAWVFFRAPSLEIAVDYMSRIFSRSLFALPTSYLSVLPLSMLMFVMEWFHRNEEHGLALPFVRNRALRWGVYLSILFILFSQHQRTSEFIYFQF